jgi:hypothetical protein
MATNQVCVLTEVKSRSCRRQIFVSYVVNGYQSARTLSSPRGWFHLSIDLYWKGFGSHVVMTSIFAREQAPRWRRGQRFGLSAAGAKAETQYQTALKSSHDQGGREALDQALAAWAAVFGVRPPDGVYLSELRIAVQTLPELVDCLEICGTTRSEVKDGLDRLISAKLAEPVS